MTQIFTWLRKHFLLTVGHHKHVERHLKIISLKQKANCMAIKWRIEHLWGTFVFSKNYNACQKQIH